MTEEEFETTARTYGDTLFRVAYHALGNQPDAEDVAQIVLLKLYQYTGHFVSGEHLKYWLLRVTLNECRRLLRTPWRRRTAPLEEHTDLATEMDDGDREVLEAVMALEGKYRIPIYLYYYEGLSIREIAQATRSKESTIQTRLQRAREQLRHKLTN